jgi:hypothetical protein
MPRSRGLTSIPTPTHIWPGSSNVVRVDLPEPDGYEYKRLLLVPYEINEALKAIVDLPKIRSILQRYISGMYVTASLQGDPNGHRPDLERLTNVNEVWVMCFRQPRFDQWRLMGRFIAPNVFVALALFRREFLNGDKNYQVIAEKFAAAWPTIDFGVVRMGASVEDYISQPVRDCYAQSII